MHWSPAATSRWTSVTDRGARRPPRDSEPPVPWRASAAPGCAGSGEVCSAPGSRPSGLGGPEPTRPEWTREWEPGPPRVGRAERRGRRDPTPHRPLRPGTVREPSPPASRGWRPRRHPRWASPKSIRTTRPPLSGPVRSTLSDLRSRCTMPREWTKESVRSNCATASSCSCSGNSASASRKGSPSMNSKVKKQSSRGRSRPKWWARGSPGARNSANRWNSLAACSRRGQRRSLQGEGGDRARADRERAGRRPPPPMPRGRTTSNRSATPTVHVDPRSTSTEFHRSRRRPPAPGEEQADSIRPPTLRRR